MTRRALKLRGCSTTSTQVSEICKLLIRDVVVFVHILRFRMQLRPRPLSPILLFGLVPVATWFIMRPFLNPVPALPALYASVGFSVLALLSTLYLVPALGPSFIKANLQGRDLLKTYQTPMSVLHLDHEFTLLNDL